MQPLCPLLMVRVLALKKISRAKAMRSSNSRTHANVFLVVMCCLLTTSVRAQVVTTVAGGGSVGGAAQGTADGVGALATLYSPDDMVCDGNICYIADTGNRLIRIMDATTYNVTTVAGSGSAGYTDGPGPTASFTGSLHALAISGNYLYIGNGYKMRMMHRTTFHVTTIAGGDTSGSADGTGVAATMNTVWSLAPSGNKLYIGDNCLIRVMDITTYHVTTIAGGSTSGYADGTGTSAALETMPRGFFISGNDLYFADYYNNRIRRMDLTNYEVKTLAGTLTAGFTDGTGPNAAFHGPHGLSLVGTTLYIDRRQATRRLQSRRPLFRLLSQRMPQLSSPCQLVLISPHRICRLCTVPLLQMLDRR